MNIQTIERKNKAIVIGILKEKKIEFKVSETGRQMAIGKLVIVCDTQLGKGEVEVKVMQMADKKDGTPNSLYKGLQTVSNEYQEGTTIKVEGSLEDATYYSANKGDFVEKRDIKATFINRVDKETPHCCKVEIEGLITSIKPVDNELEVEITTLGYQGVAMPVVGVVPEHLTQAFQSKCQVGCTISLYIAILKVVKTEEVKAEIGFGEGFGEIITKTITKNIIFGGGDIKYTGTTGAIDQESVKQGLALRCANLEDKKEKAIKKSSASSTSMATNFETGFGSVGGFNKPQGGFTVPTGFGGFPV